MDKTKLLQAALLGRWWMETDSHCPIPAFVGWVPEPNPRRKSDPVFGPVGADDCGSLSEYIAGWENIDHEWDEPHG